MHDETRSSDGTPLWERIAIFGFGVAFVVVLLVIALFVPDPTPFRYEVFKIVLALAAAGVAALIPGFIEVEYRKIVRAGGASAVFVIVYFFSPASLVIDDAPAPTDPFKIVVIIEQGDELRTNTFTFPVSDIRKKRENKEFLDLLGQLPVQGLNIDSSAVFRLHDEARITNATGDALRNRNMGVLVVPMSVLQEFDNDHLAFTFLKSQIPGL